MVIRNSNTILLPPCTHEVAKLLEEADDSTFIDFDRACLLYKKASEYATALLPKEGVSSGSTAADDDDNNTTNIDNYDEDDKDLSNEMIIDDEDDNQTNFSRCPPEIIHSLQEAAFCGLVRLYQIHEKAQLLRNLVVENKDFLASQKKVRTAKLVRQIIDAVSKIPNTNDLQVELCEECIDWCKTEKRTFLRHRVEAKLCLLYMNQKKLNLAFELVERLLKDVKKLDDKLLLVEIHLIESKLYLAAKNIAKSKVALTASRTNANAIRCSPAMQGDIDLQSGILHAYEKNYKTAFSYFYEAFEAFSSLPAYSGPSVSMQLISTEKGYTLSLKPGNLVCKKNNEKLNKNLEENKALQALKYMILSKIMCGQPDQVTVLLSGRYGLRYANEVDLEALKAIAISYKERSLKSFQEALKKFSITFKNNLTISEHIQGLYDILLEQNLLRVLEAYSRVEISRLAELMELPIEIVQEKLCEMILDGKLQGTADQGIGVLIHFEKSKLPDTYTDTLNTIKNMADVVESLYEKAKLAI